MAIEKEIDIKVDSKDAEQGFAKLADAINDLNKTFSKFSEDTKDGLEDINNTSKKTEKGVGGIAKGFKGLGVAMKAAGIGLVIGALTSMKEIFSENQRVVDAFSTVFETFSIVVNQVVTAFINVYDAVAESSENFNGLKNVLSGLLTIAITPLKLAFFGIKLGLQEAQLAWEQSFFGDKDPETIKTLNAEIFETKTRIAEVGIEAVNAGKDVINNFGDAVGEVTNIGKLAGEELSKVSIKAAYEQAQTNVELKNSAELAAAQQGFLISQLEKRAEEQRKIRDDESVSISDRIKANDKLLEITKQSNEALKTQANLQIDAAQAQFDKTGKIEDEIALTEALTNKQDLLNQIQAQQIEQNINKVALEKEQIELTNAKAESESKLSIERKRFNAEQIEDELLRLEKLKEIDVLEAEQEAIRLQAIVDNANAGTQAKVDAEIALNEFKEQSRQKNLEADQALADAQRKIDLKTLEQKKKQTDEVIGVLGNLQAVVGQQTVAGKALGIATATINTFQGASEALKQKSTLPSPFDVIAKVANVATVLSTGFKTIKSIASVNIPAVKGASGGGSAGAGSIPNIQPQAPNFNIVGATETSQLAEAIGDQTQQPVQAYVVANDVTTAQSLNNNIVEGASIG